MVVFEVKVNGEACFVGDSVTAVTLVSDFVSRRQADRVTLHVGTGGPGEREVNHLAAHLVAGDEITIRLLDEDALHETRSSPESCSFCGSDIGKIESLVSGAHVAICNGCLDSFGRVLREGAPLPVGASVSEAPGGLLCGFCGKMPPAVPGLLVRNGSAVCAECLRSCIDLQSGREE